MDQRADMSGGVRIPLNQNVACALRSYLNLTEFQFARAVLVKCIKLPMERIPVHPCHRRTLRPLCAGLTRTSTAIRRATVKRQTGKHMFKLVTLYGAVATVIVNVKRRLVLFQLLDPVNPTPVGGEEQLCG